MLPWQDAGLLDAFGKGASVDINMAKQELYAQMTWDEATHTSMYQKPQVRAEGELRGAPVQQPRPARRRREGLCPYEF